MDYIVRGTAANGMIRAFASCTRELVEEAHSIHHTAPVASAALGRLLTGAGMLGVMMKGDKDLLSITIRGDGPMGGLTATADSKGNVKGFVYEPNVPLMVNSVHKLDVGGAIGNGVMTVVKDLGLKEPYSGQIPLQNGEIGLDLAYYLHASEQVPSSVGVGVLVGTEGEILQAGGFILQLMPDASEEVIQQLESNLQGVESVTTMLEKGMTPEEILQYLLRDMNFVEMDRIPTQFHCGCDRERVRKALISVGKKELKSMIADGKPIDLHCDFCGKTYIFSIPELEEMAEKGQG